MCFGGFSCWYRTRYHSHFCQYTFNARPIESWAHTLTLSLSFICRQSNQWNTIHTKHYQFFGTKRIQREEYIEKKRSHKILYSVLHALINWKSETKPRSIGVETQFNKTCACQKTQSGIDSSCRFRICVDILFLTDILDTETSRYR